MKFTYSPPVVTNIGSVGALTAAIGSSSNDDQSDFPQQFPPGTGSFDVCNNNTQDTVC